MTELKPCPFCGSSPKWGEVGKNPALYCPRCGVHQINVTKNLVLMKWNTRHYPPEVMQAVERMKPKKPVFNEDAGEYICEGCGHFVLSCNNFCHTCGQRLDWSE